MGCGMKTPRAKPGRKLQRTTRQERIQWLTEFKHSRLSAKAFAEQHALNYATLCRWKRKGMPRSKSAEFVEVQYAAPLQTNELLVELGSGIRLTVKSAEQIEWVVTLIRRLSRGRGC